MTSKPRVGFVGMGTMGGPMARRLASSGYAVRGFDVSAERSKQAAAAGVTLATSPAEAAQDAVVVMSSLPDPATVRRAYLGPDGVLSTIRNGATLIDLSTIDPETWLWLGPCGGGPRAPVRVGMGHAPDVGGVGSLGHRDDVADAAVDILRQRYARRDQQGRVRGEEAGPHVNSAPASGVFIG